MQPFKILILTTPAGDSFYHLKGVTRAAKDFEFLPEVNLAIFCVAWDDMITKRRAILPIRFSKKFQFTTPQTSTGYQTLATCCEVEVG